MDYHEENWEIVDHIEPQSDFSIRGEKMKA